MTLQEILGWATGAGAGILAYFVIEELQGIWPWLAELSPKAKRNVSFVLIALIAALAYSAGILCGYNPLPATSLAWVETLVEVVAVAITFATGTHGIAKLRGAGA